MSDQSGPDKNGYNQCEIFKLESVYLSGILDIGIYHGKMVTWKPKILNSTSAPI